jgi:hypothetical protein
VLRKRGAETVSRRRTGAGGGAPRDGGGVPVAGVQESGEEVARKLPRNDVVLVVCLAGAERRWSVRTTVRPTLRRSSSSPALWSGLLECGKVKLDGSVRLSGLQWCYCSTGSRVGGSGGG